MLSFPTRFGLAQSILERKGFIVMLAQTFTLSEQVRAGVWEVSCITCKGSIGTMNGATLMKAVMFACDKGGVMCPDCRLLVCQQCGSGLVPSCRYPDLSICMSDRCAIYQVNRQKLGSAVLSPLSSSSNLNSLQEMGQVHGESDEK